MSRTSSSSSSSSASSSSLLSPTPKEIVAASRRKYGADAALDAVSGATFGSMCAYVREYGNPGQRYEAGRLVDLLMKAHRRQTRSPCAAAADDDDDDEQNGTTGGVAQGRTRVAASKSSTLPSSTMTSDSVDWARLRQELYELSGDWLWSHGVHHLKTVIAPKMKIPSPLLERSLLVVPIRIEETTTDMEGSGDNSKENNATYVRFEDYHNEDADKYFEADPSHGQSSSLRDAPRRSDPQKSNDDATSEKTTAETHSTSAKTPSESHETNDEDTSVKVHCSPESFSEQASTVNVTTMDLSGEESTVNNAQGDDTLVDVGTSVVDKT